jgi:hypothetical protein
MIGQARVLRLTSKSRVSTSGRTKQSTRVLLWVFIEYMRYTITHRGMGETQNQADNTSGDTLERPAAIAYVFYALASRGTGGAKVSQMGNYGRRRSSKGVCFKDIVRVLRLQSRRGISLSLGCCPFNVTWTLRNAHEC